jgi:Rad3-related DNA helicase
MFKLYDHQKTTIDAVIKEMEVKDSKSIVAISAPTGFG